MDIIHTTQLADTGSLSFIVTLAVFMASNHLFSCDKILSIEILESMFKITTEWFDMTRFPSRDGGPWDKAIRMQDLMIALQLRYVNGKDAIELVLESSKKAIPAGVGALREHEIVMGNFLDLFERATFAHYITGIFPPFRRSCHWRSNHPFSALYNTLQF